MSNDDVWRYTGSCPICGKRSYAVFNWNGDPPRIVSSHDEDIHRLYKYNRCEYDKLYEKG